MGTVVVVAEMPWVQVAFSRGPKLARMLKVHAVEPEEIAGMTEDVVARADREELDLTGAEETLQCSPEESHTQIVPGAMGCHNIVPKLHNPYWLGPLQSISPSLEQLGDPVLDDRGEARL